MSDSNEEEVSAEGQVEEKESIPREQFTILNLVNNKNIIKKFRGKNIDIPEKGDEIGIAEYATEPAGEESENDKENNQVHLDRDMYTVESVTKTYVDPHSEIEENFYYPPVVTVTVELQPIEDDV